jgi:hypothetical protein
MAAAAETEQLVVALEARIRDFERNFMRANRTANDNFGKIEKRAKQSGDNLEKSLSGAASRVAGVMKNFGAGFAGGILGGLSVAGLQQIARGIGDVANSVAMIGSNAKKAGLSNRSFQELSYVASQARIDVDALADGMKELALRADEWIVTGAGPGAEAFARLGYTAQELKAKLKDPSALLVDIVARLQQLDKAAQIRIADELFGGTAGERFVELLDKGADGIRQMIAEAHSFGLVLDDQMIAKADEIDRKFDLISKTIGTKVKGAIVSAAGELLEFMDKMKDVEERQSATLGNQLTDLGRRRLDNENAILKLRNDKETTIGGALLGPAYDKQIEHLEKEQQEIAEAEARILKILGERDQKASEATKAAAASVPDITKLNTAIGTGKSATDSAAKSLQTYGDAIRALKGEIPELAEQVAELNMRADIDKSYRAALQNARTMGQVNQANALRDQALAAVPGRMQAIRDKGVDDASKEAKQKAEDQIKAYSDIIAGAQEFMASQQQEATALGMAKDAAAAYRYEQEMLNQAKRDGIALTDDQRAQIATYAQGMAHAEKVTQQLADTQEQSAEISKFFGEQAVDALTGIATGSMTAMDALRQLLATLIKLLMQAVFLGEGPLAGNLKGTGGLFGNIGKAFDPASTATVDAVKSISAPANMAAEQTFTAPLGKVERAPLAPIQQTVEGLRGTISPDIVKPAMQEASKSFAKSITLTPKEITDLKKTLMTEWVPGQGDMQGKGIIDTILNRKASGKWGDSIGDVVNAPKQFSDVNGPPAWKHGRRSVDDLSTSDARYGRASDLVDSYLPERAAGAPSSVGDHLNYANRAYSTPNNFGWIDALDGPKLGGHKHGTTADLQRFRPGDFGVSLPKETVPPGLDSMSTGSIAAEQVEAVQQQVEAQQRLAEQMAMTQQATQAMQQPLQGIGQAATQVVPNLGGFGQGLSGLLGPLTSAVPGLGQFGGAIQSLIQQLMSMPMGGMGGAGGLLGGILGFADGGEISGPGTGTSDSIPIMASDGEFMVNAKSAKKHRRLLDAINSGHVPAFAAGGSIGAGTFAPSSTYAPSLAINVTGSGNGRQDAALAGMIAAQVDRSLDRHKPDTFRYSRAQALTKQAMDLRGASSRNG